MDYTQLSVSVFDKRSQEYQNKYMDVSLYADCINFFCKHLPTQASVLDVACGPGNVTRYILGQRPDLRIHGIDLSPNMTQLAQANNPNASFSIADGREIHYLKQTFGGIVCSFGFPYFDKHEAIAFIQKASLQLEPDGVLYISTMEDDYQQSGLQTGSAGDQVYIYYHQADYLLSALSDNGFKVLQIERKHSVMTNGKAVTDLVIVAKKN